MIEKTMNLLDMYYQKEHLFDCLLQTDINLMINHINSLGRESLNWSSPYEVAKVIMGKETLKKLNLAKITTDEIQLNKNY